MSRLLNFHIVVELVLSLAAVRLVWCCCIALQIQFRVFRSREGLCPVVFVLFGRACPQGEVQEVVRPPVLCVLLVQQVNEQVLVPLDESL